jgi:hypothetical protein
LSNYVEDYSIPKQLVYTYSTRTVALLALRVHYVYNPLSAPEGGKNLKPAKILTPCRSPALAGIFKSSVLVLSPVLAFNRERNDNEGHCVVALDPGIVSA